MGLTDLAADGTYALAAGIGPVTVAAVLASLCPVVTAMAARGMLKDGCGRYRRPVRSWRWPGRFLLVSGRGQSRSVA